MELQVEALKPEQLDKKELAEKANFLKERVVNWLNRKYLPLNIWVKVINDIAFEIDMTYVIHELQTKGTKEQALQVIQQEQVLYLEKLKTEINLWELNNE